MVTNRDIDILEQVTKWRFLTARQIKILANFPSTRTTNRRIKILCDEKYLKREYTIYGVPPVYFATEKAKKEFNLPYLTKNIRIDKIKHDILTVDTMIYMLFKHKATEIISEREMQHLKGFGGSKHFPDFIFKDSDGQTNYVEIELNNKTPNKLEENVKKNYLNKNCDKQYWIIPSSKKAIYEKLDSIKYKFDINIIFVEEMTSFVQTL